jgi:hypothetical protein
VDRARLDARSLEASMEIFADCCWTFLC